MDWQPESLLVLRDHLPLPQAYVAPRSETETILAEIWRTALSMDCVGVHDDYQDLGGDSFLATVIFGMIEGGFGMSMPMAILLKSPTIAALASEIDKLKQNG